MYGSVSTIVTVIFFVIAGYTIYKGIRKKNK